MSRYEHERLERFLAAADDDIYLVNAAIELAFRRLGRPPSTSEVIEVIRELKPDHVDAA
ncbi:hypothetical protein [Hyphobacterium marinum]|uniref:Addiction module antidote protein n=1 Tax=Hyphobacterium marinum TaxID=3116574 RepID=A0ABU7LV90_9PROT|nr:hypothetical protein [Hyphobacterium sp. Y6023]MEE2565460.1 hypothetical protein [Hyphobacterium sp. Y6023]